LDIKKDILWRVYVCFLSMILLCICVLGRAIYIQRAEGKYWKALSKEKHIKSDDIAAERGTIYSEDGNMLSTSIPIFDIHIDFGAEGLRDKEGKRFRENLDSLSLSLANLFADKTASEYKAMLKQGYVDKDRYFLLQRKITFNQYVQLRKFPLVRLGRNKSGFIVAAKDKRINPYVLLANRTIGLSRQDLSKNVGLELSYDSLLRGSTGKRLMRYTAGTYLPIEGSELDPVNGKDIVTTLDTYIQDVAENALLRMMIGNNSLHGTAIVMETSTGKIKAIANLGKQEDGSYAEDMNYGIGKTTEPGSVFKLATTLALLEDGYVDTNTVVNCEGGRKMFYGLKITDSHLGTYQTSVLDAFARSSNVAFAKLADQNYHKQPQKFVNHLHNMRLDVGTGIDIVAASGKPLIKKPSARSWSATTIPYMAHGYEELVTPLHMLTLYNTIANDGVMMKPYLVNEVREYGVTIKKIEPEIVNPKVCSKETVGKLKACMEAVVNKNIGTGHKVLYNTDYAIAGKTGTAVTAQNNKGYNKNSKVYQASFIGYFPANAPKYTIAVVVQNTRESKLIYGADVSGTVFREISDKLFAKYLAVSTYKTEKVTDTTISSTVGFKNDFNNIFSYMQVPNTDSLNAGSWRVAKVSNKQAALQKIEVNSTQKIVPNVQGMGARDAVYILESKGMQVMIQGSGKVVTQSIAAGTAIKKLDKITLFLN
jgi:cell division protein FtsI (penicillin-binding protein 3)